MSNVEFLNRLYIKLINNFLNDFGQENYDELRFGKYKSKSFKEKLKDSLRKKFIPNSDFLQFESKYKEIIPKYTDGLNFIYNNINEESQSLLIDLVAYRILGYKKIKLPLNTPLYWQAVKTAKSLKTDSAPINSNYKNIMVSEFDLTNIGYNIKMYFQDAIIVPDYIFEQYAYKINDEYIIQAEKGDIVLDIGGFWADTALYLSQKVGDTGKVYSFEFIPNNINMFNKNLSLNPNLKDRIQLVEQPISDISNRKIYYRDEGAASFISQDAFENHTGKTETITIDDFVKKQKLSKVDFIKMDIEGAELYALKGAINTIKTFKPKLGIAIYHSMDDFVSIPKWLIDLDLNYDFYLGHYTIHAEETVFFAKPK